MTLDEQLEDLIRHGYLVEHHTTISSYWVFVYHKDGSLYRIGRGNSKETTKLRQPTAHECIEYKRVRCSKCGRWT